MQRIIYIVIGMFVVISTIQAQVPKAHFDFDNCNYADKIGAINDIEFSGTPECVCGPVGDAMAVPDSDDVMWMSGTVGNILSSNFSMSFYLNLGNLQSNQLVDIITNERVCFGDSSFVVQYDPLGSQLNMYFIVSASNRVELNCTLDPNQCWHHIAVTRNKVNFTLYNNGVEVDKDTYDKGVNIFINASRPFTIGRGVCMGQKFNGALDEIKFFTDQLTPNQVKALYVPVDEILTADTVLILGDSFIPRVSNSCATSFSWLPNDGSISDVNEMMPDLEPTENIQYTLHFNQLGCIAKDSINVVVVDPSEVHCDQLFLPTAFTPNGDALNDEFGISNGYIVDEISSFDIFDKWGGIVFSSTDKNDKWDGNYKGKLLNSGVFIYKIVYQCDDKEFFKKGSFTILR